jgi:hypothetical protein
LCNNILFDNNIAFFEKIKLLILYLIIVYQQMELISKSDPTVFKVLLLGPSGNPSTILGVGKTSLLLKYIKNIFSYDYQVTVGV